MDTPQNTPDPRSWIAQEGHIPPSRSEVAPHLAVTDYHAYDTAKGGRVARRLWFYLRDGSRHMIEAYPLRIVMPNANMMMISSRTDVITLRGVNLEPLADTLSDMKVSAIHEFKTGTHHEPEDGCRVDEIHIEEVSQLA